MFKIIKEEINEKTISQCHSDFKSPDCGAYVIFKGLVRNHNEGKIVTSLEYEAYESMGIKVGNQIIEDAKKIFSIKNAFCIHRVGHLRIEDTAVIVGVFATHRQDCYSANEYIIDRIKSEVPIWKKENYLNEKPHWVNCHGCSKIHENIGYHAY
jgi:molybdopterin synthase catalytic subunit